MNVKFKMTTANGFSDEVPFSPAFVEGQILFVRDTSNGTGKIYVDYKDQRICFTPEASGSGDSTSDYLGNSTTDPTGGTVTINGSVVSNPKEGNTVSFGTKEYMYRKDADGHAGWYEIGDETMPAWEPDT